MHCFQVDRLATALLAVLAFVIATERRASRSAEGLARFVPADPSNFDTLEQVARGVGLLTN